MSDLNRQAKLIEEWMEDVNRRINQVQNSMNVFLEDYTALRTKIYRIEQQLLHMEQERINAIKEQGTSQIRESNSTRDEVKEEGWIESESSKRVDESGPSKGNE
ncbi:MAG TPA: hypothetical protein VGN34_30310 [Ktedonobacteraceae bacterium]